MSSSYGNIATNPPTFSMFTSETWPLGFDASQVTTSPTSPSSVLLDVTQKGNPTTITLSDSPTVSGSVITQIVRGSVLRAQHEYELRITFQGTSPLVATMVTQIFVLE